MKFVIVTGMSGAGKSTALKMLEDMGYFCVDNLPIALLPKFAELAHAPGSDISQVAVGVDIRNGRSLDEMSSVLEHLKASGVAYQILYLEASDEVLVKRYKETRRTHPLAKQGRVEDGIRQEREKLLYLKENATYILDTSQLLTRELKKALEQIFAGEKNFKNLMITVLSFGFKYGIPSDCDLVFDVRFLPNPYYVEGLKYKTGNDKEVQDFVMGYELSHTFLDKLVDMLEFLIPNYILEGKNQLVIGIGCTGGKHRSVTLANKLFEALSNCPEYGVRLEHRDVSR
ncbi:MAG: RNase adapter RapZ [Blautia sp.]|uniref:RNase adapter RapZ n=1 Tax=Blautia sp. OF03-15BH TaxID=2292287 RepID=UPI00082163B3|nr:RNase adapter RapZ [Blautia sp. OF03-15BH]MCI5858838.1 RNase adapter RapZ [Blautia sp.]MDY2897981.1 RNase adapter RapZ [Candidatus Limivivens sp.]SCG87560.1 glmZ(sRNA)-inactivating NTPase [uncultured Clostridium sp.]MDD5965255.1 RNase adapter RapZ [Blautia sp.]RGY03171.1 RNase adapter RapZ [Blautia sp. OF03-15BH]